MTLDKTGAQATVSHNAAANRYEISVDDQLVGHTAYRDRDHDGAAERVFFHTEVDEMFGGRGLATILIREALDDTRANGSIIVGVCPLVSAFLRKNPDYADSSRRVTQDTINWIQSVVR